MTHKSVLLQASIDGLDIKQGDIFVDGTLGDGGHSEEVLRRFGESVTIIGLDLDMDALKRSRERLEKLSKKTTLKQGSFRNIDKIIAELGLSGPKVDKILLDIGTSTFQIEESGRGFSFKKDEPLQMTFSKQAQGSQGDLETGITARDVVNSWAEESLRDIIYGFGEERYAKRIAEAIVEARARKPIETTSQLEEIIFRATPSSYHHGKIHPATKTFQAIRIAVNDELGALKEGIEKGFECLSPGGRMAVTSFHSLEDRIVKTFFRQLKDEGKATLITKKPIVPSEEEIEANPRSRSAKLRIISKI